MRPIGILAIAAAAGCGPILKPQYLEDPAPTGTLRVARTHAPDREGDPLGAACGVGDVDGDGRADYAIGYPHAGDRPRVRGEVRIHSGRDGSVIRRLEAPEGSSGFGESIALLPDLDGDDLRDLAIAAPGFRRDIGDPGERPGVVEIRSTANGRLLRTLAGAPEVFGFGSSIGLLEIPALLLVAADEDASDSASTDAISAFSLADGSPAYRVAGIGGPIAVVGDIDRDGCPDFAGGGREGVSLHAGRSGRVIRHLPTRLDGSAIPSAEDFDLDRDGVPDVIVAESVFSPMALDGRLTVHSGRDGSPLWTQRVYPNDAVLLAPRGDWLVVAGNRSLLSFRLPETAPARVLAMPEGGASTLALAGDVDGDGIDDMLLGNGFGLAQVQLVSSSDLRTD